MGIRSFLALPISAGLAERLRQVIHDLELAGADVKWVRPENIHLTVKFLGDMEPPQLEAVSAVLERCCPSFERLCCRLEGIGAFPELRQPKILWAGLNDPQGKIQAVVETLEGELAKAGIPREDRPFKSHLTLGRMRSHRGLAGLLDSMGRIRLDDQHEETFSRIVLYKSTLTSQGPVYDLLKEFHFCP